MSRLAPLVDPLVGENVASTTASATNPLLGKAAGGAPVPRRAVLADVSNRQGNGDAAQLTGASGAGGAGVKQALGGGAARPALVDVQAPAQQQQPQAAACEPTVGPAAPALAVLSDAEVGPVALPSPPVLERLAGRSGLEEEAALDAVAASVAALRVSALAAGAARYPVAPLSESARAQQSLRAFTCLDEAEEAAPRPASPGAFDSPASLLLPAARHHHQHSLDGALPSPSSSAAADWGGDSSTGGGDYSPAFSSDHSTMTTVKEAGMGAGAPAASPTLARALAALDLVDGPSPPPADSFADALADWDAALAAVDGGGSSSPSGSLPCLGGAESE